MSEMNKNEAKLQEIHDRMVASAPEGAEHPADCIFCSGEYAALVEGGTVSDKTYTDDEVKAQIAAAVAAATSEIQTQLDSLKAGEETAAMQAKIDEAKAEFDAQIAELTTKLDEAVLEAQTAKTERDELTAFLDAESARVIAEAEAETRKADRIAQVAAVVTFPEDHVKERAEMWASLEDDKFEALLADYKVMGEKSPPAPKSEPLPRVTAMQSSRETDKDTVVGSAVLDLIRGRNFGVDPRAIR